MSSGSKVLVSVLVGAAAGLVGGLLAAPKSGEETREANRLRMTFSNKLKKPFKSSNQSAMSSAINLRKKLIRQGTTSAN
ncbi:MAG: hypothetical protein BRD50_05555 [Bacteroidetes bacterium SW_11_45_7]|nr:MAG: hypothetical protein BRD50_05555 [Bacteroidetes bacterium SW_11_45_7]